MKKAKDSLTDIQKDLTIDSFEINKSQELVGQDY
jgi:hypothetical protein